MTIGSGYALANRISFRVTQELPGLSLKVDAGMRSQAP